MSEFVFSPPLKLAPRATVNTLSEASAYIQMRVEVRRPFTAAARAEVDVEGFHVRSARARREGVPALG
jgi:hypothetical protein